MRRRALGDTGLSTSILGLGAGPLGDASLDDGEVERLVHAALDLGITFFDTARSYGRSEERLGRALVGREVLVSTKVGYGVEGLADWTGPCVARGIDEALARLRRERLDVVHLHSCGPEVLARDDVMAALFEARAAGKVGCVAYAGDGEGLRAARALDFAIFQTSFNLVDQEAAAGADERGWIGKRTLLNAAFARHGEVGPDVAEYRRRFHEARWPSAVHEDPADVALRFAAFGGPHVVLVGTTRVEHLRRAVESLARGPLTPALCEAMGAEASARGWPGLI